MKNNKDPLDHLIVDEDVKPDLNLIAEILNGNVRLNKSGKVLLESNFKKLPYWKQVLVYLIAKKAIVIKKLGEKPIEACKPIEIREAIYVDNKLIGTCLVRELKTIVTKEKERYFIPNYNLLKTKKVFNGEIPVYKKQKGKEK